MMMGEEKNSKKRKETRERANYNGCEGFYEEKKIEKSAIREAKVKKRKVEAWMLQITSLQSRSQPTPSERLLFFWVFFPPPL